MTALKSQLHRSRQVPASGYLIPTLGLLVEQIAYGCLAVLNGSLLSSGADPFLIVYGNNLTMFLFLAPSAALFDRRKWPERLGGALALYILLISLGGVTGNQVLLMMGLQRTSPPILSSMGNLSPGLVFIIACCLRFEKFDIKCKYSAAKAIGTLLCLFGVGAMTLLQNSENDGENSSSIFPGPSQDWIIGCVCLFSAVFMDSCAMIVKAAALEHMPAPLSLTAITSFMGAVFAMAIQLFQKGTLDPGKYSVSTASLVVCVVMGGVVKSLCQAFNTWCISKQGPVFVSMFSPISTVTSAILSTVVLGKFLSLGSLAGVMVMIVGLYTVLWAKRKEYLLPVIVDGGNCDDVDKNELFSDGGLKRQLLS